MYGCGTYELPYKRSPRDYACAVSTKQQIFPPQLSSGLALLRTWRDPGPQFLVGFSWNLSNLILRDSGLLFGCLVKSTGFLKIRNELLLLCLLPEDSCFDGIAFIHLYRVQLGPASHNIPNHLRWCICLDRICLSM